MQGTGICPRHGRGQDIRRDGGARCGDMGVRVTKTKSTDIVGAEVTLCRHREFAPAMGGGKISAAVAADMRTQARGWSMPGADAELWRGSLRGGQEDGGARRGDGGARISKKEKPSDWMAFLFW